jgi:transposase
MDGMQDMPVEIKQYIQQLEEENHLLRQAVRQLEQQIHGLQERVTQLENKLKAYENPHMPPSMQRFKGTTSGTNPPGKRGAPPGHRGATRDKPEPDEIIPVTMDQCPQCGSYLGSSISVESRTIEEIPPPQKILVTRYDLHTYICTSCGYKVTATHKDLSKGG